MKKRLLNDGFYLFARFCVSASLAACGGSDTEGDPRIGPDGLPLIFTDDVREVLEPYALPSAPVEIVDMRMENEILHEELRITAPDGQKFRAFRLTPTNADGTAVLVIHGHSGSAELATYGESSYLRALGLRLAEAGFIVLAPDVRSFGAFIIDGMNHSTYANHVFEEGDVYVRLAINDARTALSVLEASPGVDPERMGVAGISLGGFISMMVAVSEPEKIRAATVSGIYLPFSKYFSNAHHFCQHLLVLRDVASSTELAFSILPRALQIHWGEMDPFGFDEGFDHTSKLENLAEEFGLDDSLEIAVSPGLDHVFDPPVQVEFFDRRLHSSEEPN